MEERPRIGFVREMTRKVLKKYNVTQPGTPLEEIARGENLSIVLKRWRESVGGLLLRSERIIGVNANHHPNRQRFSIAHEMGHYFLNHTLDEYETGITLDDPPIGHEASKIQNREADEFANELLVPLSILKGTFKTVTDVDTLAKIFQVSKQVMFIALDKHSLFDKIVPASSL